MRTAAMGSSPLARGTPLQEGVGSQQVGLIPARAGNTHRSPDSPPYAWAHPRSRGEHGKGCPEQVHEAGSSPLARGTQPIMAPALSTRGLIPARAGNTLPHAVENPRRRAHPRSRGEHRAGRLVLNSVLGSSPLARGTRRKRAPLPGGTGLIPARAGNTGNHRFPRQSYRAHPRSRGEHWPA